MGNASRSGSTTTTGNEMQTALGLGIALVLTFIAFCLWRSFIIGERRAKKACEFAKFISEHKWCSQAPVISFRDGLRNVKLCLDSEDKILLLDFPEDHPDFEIMSKMLPFDWVQLDRVESPLGGVDPSDVSAYLRFGKILKGQEIGKRWGE